MNTCKIKILFAALMMSVHCVAQTPEDVMKNLEGQGYKLDGTVVENQTYVVDKTVVTNPFWHNCFFTGAVGMHSYQGDFSNYGKFSETISPNWFVGLGKWFTPSVGIKLEYGMGVSNGFMDVQYPTPFCYGDLISNSKGNQYWKTKNKWLDFSVSGMINISRALFGYEGPYSSKLKNQFILNLGIGYIHHRGMEKSYYVADDLCGHAEFQYSRFLSNKKNISIDAKARGLFYQTNFDKHANHKGSKQWDANVGFSVGMTFYLKHYVWGYKVPTEYVTNYLTLTHEKKPEVAKTPEHGQLTFYVFYPNNYSGRNDAPQIEGAAVNAIDYLAGGTYTQKQYKDKEIVTSYMEKRKSPIGLDYVDLPTVKANMIDGSDFVAHGYEISKAPLSLSMETDSLVKFYSMKSFYYAPIWDGQNVWQYRIDDATKGQRLLDDANYRETDSYGLNSSVGMEIVRQNLYNSQSGEQLYSFADVYAAIEGNMGYISQYADKDRVAYLSRIFNEGTILSVSATGVATSQDNSSRGDSNQIGFDRNTALAQNRANTVVAWLKKCKTKSLADAQSQIFLVNELNGPVRKVDDKSTRGLNAKLNRCVKVTIDYFLK